MNRSTAGPPSSPCATIGAITSTISRPTGPRFPYSEAYRDPAKMLIYELARAYEGALLRDDRAYTIRANYGLVLLALHGRMRRLAGSGEHALGRGVYEHR